MCCLLLIGPAANAQPTAGTTGLLNIPTAEMQTDGTFLFGGNFLPEQITPTSFPYHTGNYFLNITFLPFCEVNYRCTLIQTLSSGKYNQQDRSFGLRLRVMNEKKNVPSLVFGGNDIYSSAGSGNQYFGAAYAVATKHFKTNRITLGTTIGYGFDVGWNKTYNGLFGGISLEFSALKNMQFITEYDTRVLNLGVSALLFKHLYLYVFAYDTKYLTGGIQYKVFLQG